MARPIKKYQEGGKLPNRKAKKQYSSAKKQLRQEGRSAIREYNKEREQGEEKMKLGKLPKKRKPAQFKPDKTKFL